MGEVNEEKESGVGALKSRQADWLDVHGGFVLLLGGCVLIALAGLLADHVAVAPIFATFGCGLLLFAAFYSRIEGRVEASRRGFAAAVGAAQRLSRDLPAELREEVVERAVENVEVSSRKPKEARRAGEEAAMRAVEELASRLQHDDLVEAFRGWLIDSEGYSAEGVEEEVRSGGRGVDLLARKDDEVLVAEMKTRTSLLGAGNVFSLLHFDPKAPEGIKVRRAFVIPVEQKDDLRVADVVEIGSVEIYGVSLDGQVERLI